jgi:hypothetical protein
VKKRREQAFNLMVVCIVGKDGISREKCCKFINKLKKGHASEM